MKTPRVKPPPAKTLVITRPREDALTLAALLKAQGFRCIVEPMLTIEPLHENKKSLTTALKRRPQAILATSRHAISVFARMTKRRSVPVIAVGKATASHAASLGFRLLATAGGTAGSLVTHTKKCCTPERGRLLYICGADISVDIAQTLARRHFITDTVVLYRARAAQRFSKHLRDALARKAVDGVVFFSLRSANAYVKLALRHNLKEEHRPLSAFSMSAAIAGTLRKLPWKHIRTAARPDTKSMLDKVNSLRR